MLANKFVLLILFTKRNARLIKNGIKKKKIFHPANDVTNYISQNRERERERKKKER